MKIVYDLLQVENPDGSKKPRSKKSQKQLDSRTKIEWTSEHQKIIEDMVCYLKSPAVISYPDFSKPFVIHCDASQLGLGAVLYQKQEGETKVISFASLTLSPAERNYYLHSGKLEFLAMKWSICDRWRDYLIGGDKFEVITDNNPLTYVLTTARLNATGLRWVSDLANFHFSIRYWQGKIHLDADYLSRHPIDEFAILNNECDQVVTDADVSLIFSEASKRESSVNCVEIQRITSSSGADKVSGGVKVSGGGGRSRKGVQSGGGVHTGGGGISYGVQGLVATVVFEQSESERISNEQLSKAQKDDPVISPVYDIILRKKEVKRDEMKALSKESKVLLRQRRKLDIIDNVLVRQTKTLRQHSCFGFQG